MVLPSLPAHSPFPRYSCLLVLVAGLIAHGLSLRAQFYMDDFMHLIESDRLIEGEGLFSWRRLLPYLAYFSIYKVAGFSPLAYHLLNLTIHLGLSIFVLWSVRDFGRFLAVSEGGDRWFSLPLLAALVFACHPLGSEPVNYARCTPILLVGAFSYVAAWATLRWFFIPEQRSFSFTMAVVAIAGATFSKEPGMVHALGSVAVVAWFCHGQQAVEGVEGRRRAWNVKFLVGAVVLIVLLAIPGFYLARVSVHAIAKPEFIEHALTHCRVFWMYVQRMILPIDLSGDHFILWTKSWKDWPALFGLAGIVIAGVGVFWFGKRNRLMSIAVVLAAFHLLMRMGYVIGHEMMVEYRAYPSLPWVAILYAGFIIWIPKRVIRKSAVARLCTVAFVVFLALLSVARSTLWSKPSALARDVLRQYPDNNRARAALMRQLLLREQYDAVALEYQEVLKSVAVMSDNIQSTDAVRRYDYDRFIGDWTVAENSYALALVELNGVDAALLHLDRTIEILTGSVASSPAEKMDVSLRDLISFRDRLREFDKEQDGDASGQE